MRQEAEILMGGGVSYAFVGFVLGVLVTYFYMKDRYEKGP